MLLSCKNQMCSFDFDWPFNWIYVQKNIWKRSCVQNKWFSLCESFYLYATTDFLKSQIPWDEVVWLTSHKNKYLQFNNRFFERYDKDSDWNKLANCQNILLTFWKVSQTFNNFNKNWSKEDPWKDNFFANDNFSSVWATMSIFF